MRYVTAHRTPGMTGFATDVMNAGANATLIAACALLGLVVVATFRTWRVAVAAVAALGVATLLGPALKGVVERPRPSGALALVEAGGRAVRPPPPPRGGGPNRAGPRPRRPPA